MPRKPNVVSLTVHRNMRERRQRKQLRKDMHEAVDRLAREGARGYAFFAWDRNGTVYSLWETGKIMPLWTVPEVVRNAMLTETQTYFATDNDDFEPEAG